MKITPAYTAHATATGGRDGAARIAENPLEIALATPVALGGSGKGNNPEQLFAAGYAGCFLSAMNHAPRLDKTLPKTPADASVSAAVSIGQREDVGFGLAVALDVTVPGVDRAEAQRLIDFAHKVCPYSNAVRGNIEVTVTLV